MSTDPDADEHGIKLIDETPGRFRVLVRGLGTVFCIGAVLLMCVGLIYGTWSCFSYLWHQVDHALAVFAIVFFPAMIVFAPLYAWIRGDGPRLAIIVYGGTLAVAVLWGIGAKLNSEFR